MPEKTEPTEEGSAMNREAHALLFGPTETREAEQFLASGGRPIARGFDPLDPEIRRTMIDRPAKEFIDFQVNPVPAELAVKIGYLPSDWQDRVFHHELAETICRTAEERFGLPPHLYVSLNERKELWICLK